jgi:hypothetical protein
MSTGYLTNWSANTAVDAVLAGSTWLALHTDDPSPLGSGSSELLGGLYARQPIAFAVAASRAGVSVNAQVFTGLLAAAVPYFAVWNAQTGGNMLYVVVLDDPIVISDNGQLRVPAGDIALAF